MPHINFLVINVHIDITTQWAPASGILAPQSSSEVNISREIKAALVSVSHTEPLEAILTRDPRSAATPVFQVTGSSKNTGLKGTKIFMGSLASLYHFNST